MNLDDFIIIITHLFLNCGPSRVCPKSRMWRNLTVYPTVLRHYQLISDAAGSQTRGSGRDSRFLSARHILCLKLDFRTEGCVDNKLRNKLSCQSRCSARGTAEEPCVSNKSCVTRSSLAIFKPKVRAASLKT